MFKSACLRPIAKGITEPLQPISTNRGPRARAIPRSWAKKQPNNHTNPSISDDSTVDTKLDKLLYPRKKLRSSLKAA
ncbi:hypothetical protein GJ744_008480 [Endocarpon pusillum]|uniref:Uncharacterized protein n=1 Tax=Endocarpon pusillum TaxID=364733 RepID=A0A8H7A7N4_9EURO|nr:hypothetical protein GJ744_008480 [Endocarpon pusillum]